MGGWLWVLLFAVGVLAIGVGGTRAFWAVSGHLRRKRAGPAPVRATRKRLWRDPGAVETLDLASGAGGIDGAPEPPFTFMEDHGGTLRPCVSVRDARGRIWRVKTGNEVHSEPFACRIAWAAGYFVETNYFLPSGEIVDRGPFTDACFELDDRQARKHFDEHGWAWNDNPFVGTRELNGLKIVLLLLSNWDNKDVRDVARGSNTAIFEYTLPDGTSEARYLVTDWGGSMGAWGGTVLSRGKWDCKAYEEQSAQFLVGVAPDGRVQWGYSGQRTADVVFDITVDDVAWIYRRLGRLSDVQIRQALNASGASPAEADAFTAALRSRINQLCAIVPRTY
jgi:hypothetical protein